MIACMQLTQLKEKMLLILYLASALTQRQTTNYQLANCLLLHLWFATAPTVSLTQHYLDCGGK